jgi:hypothetical protein
MQSIHKFSLAVVITTSLFLIDFTRATADKLPPKSTPIKLLNPAPHKLKSAAVKVKSPLLIEQQNVQQLDLSVPFKDVDLNAVQFEPLPIETNIFAPDLQKKPQQLQLKGQFIKFPDPEIEKRKSVDGAGIVINIKP